MFDSNRVGDAKTELSIQKETVRAAMIDVFCFNNNRKYVSIIRVTFPRYNVLTVSNVTEVHLLAFMRFKTCRTKSLPIPLRRYDLLTASIPMYPV